MDDYLYNMENTEQMFEEIYKLRGPLFHFLITFFSAILVIIFSTTEVPWIKLCDNVLFLITIQFTFWIVTQVIGANFQRRNHFIKMHGYFDFSYELNMHRSALLTIVNMINAVMLLCLGFLIVTRPLDYSICKVSSSSSLPVVISAFMLMQFTFTTLIVFKYIVLIRFFYLERPESDIENDFRRGMNSDIPYQFGYRTNGESDSYIIDHYIDLICYLQTANSRLRAQLLANTYDRPDIYDF